MKTTPKPIIDNVRDAADRAADSARDELYWRREWRKAEAAGDKPRVKSCTQKLASWGYAFGIA